MALRKEQSQLARPLVRALVFFLVTQVLLLVVSSAVIDGGRLLKSSCFASIAAAFMPLWVLFSRPSQPTRIDLLLIRISPVALFYLFMKLAL